MITFSLMSLFFQKRRSSCSSTTTTATKRGGSAMRRKWDMNNVVSARGNTLSCIAKFDDCRVWLEGSAIMSVQTFKQTCVRSRSSAEQRRSRSSICTTTTRRARSPSRARTSCCSAVAMTPMGRTATSSIRRRSTPRRDAQSCITSPRRKSSTQGGQSTQREINNSTERR